MNTSARTLKRFRLIQPALLVAAAATLTMGDAEASANGSEPVNDYPDREAIEWESRSRILDRRT